MNYSRISYKVKAQIIVFCAALIWAMISVISAGVAAAFEPAPTPSVLDAYDNVSIYNDYAYGSSAAGEAIAYKRAGKWELSCQVNHHLSSKELLEQCNVPIGTARHLRVLQHNEWNHEIFVSMATSPSSEELHHTKSQSPPWGFYA